MKGRTITALVTIAGLIVIGLGTTALAAEPPTVTDISGTFDLGNLNEGPAGAVCPFPVGAVVTATNAIQITFEGQGVGYAAFQRGQLRVTLTNLDTRESFTLNISGPTNLDVNGSGLPTNGTGPWLVFEPIAQGGLRYLRGNISFVPVSYGVHATLNAGTEQDLCDRLA